MAFELPDLPYATDALEPHISARTFEFHHGKHHKGYVDKLNKLVADTPFAQMPLDEIVKATSGDPQSIRIFNNAAQHWNHSFFWNSLTATAAAPGGELAERLDRDLGGSEGFKEAFTTAGAAQFGSGWVWLVVDRGTLKTVTTGNARNPMTEGLTPLLVCDVWEHAYYLDYQNRRADYLNVFVEKLVNWSFAAERLSSA